ncbi:MAG: hypothetical protein HY560_09740 [Gemmatimonadetes bacterium]|nr:hypothetical protein [Gemmatimonadota bacterium]
MRHVERSPILAIAIVALTAPVRPAPAQEITAVAHSIDVSRSRAAVRFDFSDDSRLAVAFSGGRIFINSRDAGRYQSGGPLERSWRGLLAQSDTFSTTGLVRAVREWKVDSLAGGDLVAKQALDAALRGLTAAPAPRGMPLGAVAPAAPVPPPGALVLPPSPEAAPAFRETLRENIRSSVRRSVEEAVAAARAAQETNPNPEFLPGSRSSFAGVGPTLAALVGVFVALACIGFGLLSFAPRQLETVAETVRSSFVRSFFAGLFAQPLILPALGTLIVALVLTVVGILLVPVAVVAFVLGLALAAIGGYIAAARALGELYVRRRMAQGGFAGGDTPFRAILIGLMALLAIWAPFAVLGWVPGTGAVLLWIAILFTWVMATVGLGAAILSRGGLRGTFGRRVSPELSGEISWSTVDEIAPSKPEVKDPVS